MGWMPCPALLSRLHGCQPLLFPKGRNYQAARMGLQSHALTWDARMAGKESLALHTTRSLTFCFRAQQSWCQAGRLARTRYKRRQNAGNLGGLEQVLVLSFKSVSLDLKCLELSTIRSLCSGNMGCLSWEGSSALDRNLTRRQFGFYKGHWAYEMRILHHR